MKQEVTLTGLDTLGFKAALEGISMIHGMFAKYACLQPWEPGWHEEWRTVRVQNNYFSVGAAAEMAEDVAFDDLVDPDGVLASVVGNKYHHTAENDVGYFVRTRKDEGGFR